MDRDADLLEGIDHVNNGRDAAALESFALAADGAAAPSEQRDAAALAAQVSLRLGRPYEAIAWTDRLRALSSAPDEADLLEAAALVATGDGDGALALLEGVTAPEDERSYPPSLVAQLRCRAHAVAGHNDTALAEAVGALRDDWAIPEIWRTIAMIAAEDHGDISDAVQQVPQQELLQVLGWLVDLPTAGTDRIVETMWSRFPGDPRILAFMSSIGNQLPLPRAIEWSTRLRAAGLARDCAVLGVAARDELPARERVRAAAIAASVFGDDRAQPLLEVATTKLADRELASTLAELTELAPDDLFDSFIVAAASTPERSLELAGALVRLGADDAAVALTRHALAGAAEERRHPTTVVRALASGDRDRIATAAEVRGHDDVVAALRQPTESR